MYYHMLTMTLTSFPSVPCLLLEPTGLNSIFVAQYLSITAPPRELAPISFNKYNFSDTPALVGTMLSKFRESRALQPSYLLAVKSNPNPT